MKAYNVTYALRYGGEIYGERTQQQLFESPINTELVPEDFDSLYNTIEELGDRIGCSCCVLFGRQRVIYYWNGYLNPIVGETSECKDWCITITSDETTLTMEELRKFNADDVSLYLSDRANSLRNNKSSPNGGN